MQTTVHKKLISHTQIISWTYSWRRRVNASSWLWWWVMGCWNWTQPPAYDILGVQSHFCPCLLVGRIPPCRDAEGTCARGVSRGKGPVAGKRWILPLPDQDSISYFMPILQTIKLLFASSAEKELKILQSWLKKGKKQDWCYCCLILLFGWGIGWVLISRCNWDKRLLSAEVDGAGEQTAHQLPQLTD